MTEVERWVKGIPKETVASLHWGFINVPGIQLDFRVQSIDDTDLKLLTIKKQNENYRSKWWPWFFYIFVSFLKMCKCVIVFQWVQNTCLFMPDVFWAGKATFLPLCFIPNTMKRKGLLHLLSPDRKLESALDLPEKAASGSLELYPNPRNAATPGASAVSLRLIYPLGS